MTDYDEICEEAIEIERSFWYVLKHWDEYCRFCETHDPDNFSVPDNT